MELATTLKTTMIIYVLYEFLVILYNADGTRDENLEKRDRTLEELAKHKALVCARL